MPILSIEIPWDPNITQIGGLLLTWHGLFTAIGIFAGVRLSLELVKIVDYDYDDAYTLALVGVLSGIVGARLLFVFEHWDSFSNDPVAILRITEGGISIWGAILGGVSGGLVFGLWRGYPVARGLDLASFGIILGQAVGRLGDLVNGEHLAKASELPWAVFYTHEDSPAFVHSLLVGPHHPATTYELLGDLVILGALFVLLFRVFWHKPGLTFCCYLVGYAVMRFFLTYLRIDSSETFLLDLRVPQLVSLLVVLCVLPVAWYFATRPSLEEPAPLHRLGPIGRLLGARS